MNVEIRLLLGLLLGVILGAGQRVEAEEILFFQSSFLPQSVTIQRGGTITFAWRRGIHTVTSGLPDGEPGTPDEPGARFETRLDEENPTFSHTFDFDETEGLAFFDRESPGQIGFIKIDSGEETFRVGVVDNAFLPDVSAAARSLVAPAMPCAISSIWAFCCASACASSISCTCSSERRIFGGTPIARPYSSRNCWPSNLTTDEGST